MSTDMEQIYAHYNRVMTLDEIASGVDHERAIWERWHETAGSDDIMALELMRNAVAISSVSTPRLDRSP